MKKTKAFTYAIFSILLCFLFALTGSASDSEDKAVLLGRVVSSDDTDLSGYKIEIWTMENPSKVIECVYTDTAGEFSFSKPDEDFYCELVYKSLPSGYGIRNRFIYRPDGTSVITFYIEPVADVKIDFESGTSFSAYGKDGTPLYAHMELAEDVISYEGITYEELKALTEIKHTGVVYVGAKLFEFEEYKQVAEADVSEKLYLLKEGQSISERHYWWLYIDLLGEESESEFGCGTAKIGMAESIRAYAVENSDEELLGKLSDKAGDLLSPTLPITSEADKPFAETESHSEEEKNEADMENPMKTALFFAAIAILICLLFAIGKIKQKNKG